ncbi:nucleic-acid-binding protein from transposon X-element [Nephila pilipes]|uniref:Nucleic-acid-binding protein from transposon X-element n=1 Tax=Nephila pilipes TaxID=299642 RepID=A0A8X6MQW5_NEPPI|nr:nucleic-acid-binding protein from transposon X-element [Nephila pilipes]
MNEVDAAALRRMSNPSPPSSAPPKKQVSVRPSQDAVAATSHADDNEMDQCWDSESEDSPMNSGPLDLNSLAVYVANQTTIDGTLEAIRALRGQETRINSVNFPSEAEKDKYQHFLRELMEEATRKSTPASQGAKKQRTTNDAIESSTNRFNNLSVDEREEYISDDEDVTTPPPKKQYAPPITIDNIQNSTTLLKKLKNLTQLNLTGKLIGSSLRVYPQTAAAYHQIRSFISQENLQHYTYQLPEDKMIRAVIRGMPIDTPVQEILQDLDELNIHAEECHIMTNKRNDTPMPLFLVTLKKTDENKEIFNLTEICSLKIEVEALRKKIGPAQCHRCQGFFHNSRYCTRNPKCVKCGKNHLTKDCTKPKEVAPTCCHCNGAHTSNYLQCPMNHLNRPSKAEKMKSQTEERIRLKTILKEKRQPLRINRPVIHTTPTSYAQAAATKVIPTTQGIPESSTPTQAPLSNLQDPLDTFDQLKNPQVIEMFDILQNFIAISTSNKSRSQKLKEIMALLKEEYNV